MKIVIGGKYWDKANGNTYHKAKIIDGTTGEITYSDYEYGYGTAYMQTAKEIFPNEMLIDGGSFYMKKADCKNGRF